ncbi:hypothetical protein K1T71_007641 [Dendrolimus kikuchii]|uniref:Uncharacterized protein n=1 Tax=Dendrolimus kikuchii TaxID=765133 RepID=A0ACC1CXZ3_9NEOP|nr:hypothetical protein K1T71_007641 [Dendrolimus kikuchii]
MLFFLITILITEIIATIIQNEKSTFCKTLNCDDKVENRVCGIRQEKEGYRLRLFKNECQLLKYGCEAERNFEFGKINIEYCENGFVLSNYDVKKANGTADEKNNCFVYDCSETNLGKKVCGIRDNGNGYQIRLFENNCELFRYNCENKKQFEITDTFICNGLVIDNKITTKNVNINAITMPDIKANGEKTESEINLKTNYNIHVESAKSIRKNREPFDPISRMKLKNIIIVDTPLNTNVDIKDTIDNFFAATHVFDLPLKEIDNELNETRRMHLKIAGPVKVFKPWITIPKNISEDYNHAPTLSSCFHKCPTKCPETYAPVCGRPGIVAREPTLVFKNHCFMDYAQCKMRWENKSPTAISSNYIESSFLFCLGDELNGLYRFLPLIRTLQHMGRLKKKGQFHYKLKNMRFFNNLLRREPKFMG